VKARAITGALAIAGSVLAAGCLSGAGGTTGLNAFTISVPADTHNLTIPIGGFRNSTVTIARYGLVDGAITLTAEQVPAGLTVTFTPAIIPGSSTTSVMKIALNDSATVGGTGAFAVRATTPGYSDILIGVPIVVGPAGSIRAAPIANDAPVAKP
jgi:hypothetical protein